ncbi:MAG: hypothetical protein M3Z26_10585 [Bacteroidota bacterium]|nr:hypothetical protein [Bacteroidota bacterium]
MNGKIFGQTVQSSESQNNNAIQYQRHLEEKIFVHTDRSSYLCGDVLWFKAYLTNAANNQPLSLSKVVYVEVLNKLHQPVLQGKIAMDKGFGDGSFYLPFSVESGNYILRAYTSWMKNFSSDHFFEKNICIINTTSMLDSPSVHESINYSASFFPEGGNLVNGLESLVAFKVNDNKNKGTECEGIIVDQFADTVAHFKTLQFGMGHFYLKPETGKEYTAVINFKNEVTLRKNLPKAYENGYVMHISDTGLNELKISIQSRGAQIHTGQLFLIIQNNHQPNKAELLSSKNNEAVLIENKDQLRSGISEITVFDENKKPVCERLYFKRPQNKMLITAKVDKENFALRSKVVVNFSAADQSSNPLPGNLSASVYRLDNLNPADQENIFNYLWLSSDLRGNIEEPDYYFKNENTETNEALDNLLLTQGWRKFDWDDPQNKMSYLMYAPEYAGHIITAKITNEITKEPIEGVQAYLSVPGRRVQLRVCMSDSNGLVHFDMKDFFGANQIVLQTNQPDSNFHLEIFSPFSEKFSNEPLPAFYSGEKLHEDLISANIHMEVQNAYHENQLQEISKALVDSVPFYFQSYKTYLLGDYTRFTTMEEVMREYVAEVNVRRNGKNFRFMTVNIPGFELRDMQPAEPMFENDPLVLLDGVPIFDINKIIAYDPLKVQKLEVVAEKYHYGTVTADGILSYTTYKGNLEDFKLDTHDLVLDYEGLQQKRIFYSPEYNTETGQQSHLPDFRDVLLWNPELNTDSNGKGNFSFYTGDVPGKYLVVVQGISSNGFAGSYSFIFNVKR